MTGVVRKRTTERNGRTVAEVILAYVNDLNDEEVAIVMTWHYVRINRNNKDQAPMGRKHHHPGWIITKVMLRVVSVENASTVKSSINLTSSGISIPGPQFGLVAAIVLAGKQHGRAWLARRGVERSGWVGVCRRSSGRNPFASPRCGRNPNTLPSLC
jgi:hypothetical protein